MVIVARCVVHFIINIPGNLEHTAMAVDVNVCSKHDYEIFTLK